MNATFANLINNFSPYVGDGLLKHIHQHLANLFNTRQNSVTTTPDYGIPDLISLYQGLPHTETEIENKVRAVIEKYEPRLSHISVKKMSTDESKIIFKLLVSAMLYDHKPVEFMVLFNHDETVHIQ